MDSALIIMKPNIRKHLNLTRWGTSDTKLILLIDLLRDIGNNIKYVMLLHMLPILDSLSIYSKGRRMTKGL